MAAGARLLATVEGHYGHSFKGLGTAPGATGSEIAFQKTFSFFLSGGGCGVNKGTQARNASPQKQQDHGGPTPLNPGNFGRNKQ
jgi:hypothetical protein